MFFPSLLVAKDKHLTNLIYFQEPRYGAALQVFHLGKL